ncbi:MAG: hypothetical protein HY303_17160 [Candidatus Wallbacteria bacterium]|nr:hypothetical protein [Candidatus Wallbacteria bacterium]
MKKPPRSKSKTAAPPWSQVVWDGRHWAAIVMLWPFLFLAAHTVGGLEVGNDFRVLYHDYKLYMFGMLSGGHFPLWSPSEGAGCSLVANPFVGALYPLNCLYLLYYWVAGGLTPWDYLMFTILALSIFGLGVYLWLRALGTEAPIAAVAAMVASTSLRTTEILRFPNAAHAAAWLPWLLYGLTLAADAGKVRRGACVLAFGALSLLTAGYPYYAVYSVFLTVPYALAMLWPRARQAFFSVQPERASSPIQMLVWSGVGAASACALAYPWLAKVRHLLSQLVDRGTPSFSYATAHLFNHVDTLGSWIFPPASQMEGWYSFGMFTTLAIGFWFLCTVAGAELRPGDRCAWMLAGGWMALVSWFTWGRESLLFRLVWHHTPILNQMRVWGRMNIVLVPVIALLLARSLAHLLQVVARRSGHEPTSPRGLAVALSWFKVLAVAVFLAQLGMLGLGVRDEYWIEDASFARDFARVLFPFEYVYPAMTVLSAAAVLGFMGIGKRFPLASPRVVLLATAMTLSALELIVPANGQWAGGHSHEKRQPFDSPGALKASFAAPRSLAYPGILAPRFPFCGVGLWENWGYLSHSNLYRRYLKPDGSPLTSTTPTETAAITRFFGASETKEKLFISQRIDHETPLSFLTDVDSFAVRAKPHGEVLTYDGDRLRVRVDLAEPACLTYVDNWDLDWRATLDGALVPMERLFGAYKTVRVPSGRHEIAFEYRPW